LSLPGASQGRPGPSRTFLDVKGRPYGLNRRSCRFIKCLANRHSLNFLAIGRRPKRDAPIRFKFHDREMAIVALVCYGFEHRKWVKSLKLGDEKILCFPSGRPLRRYLRDLRA